MLQTSTVILVPFSDSSEPAIPSQHFLKYTNNPNSCQCTVLSRWLHILLPKLTAFTSSSCAETRRDCRCENLREKQLKQERDNKFCMFLIEFEKRQFYHFFVSPIGYVGMICNRYIWQGSQGLVIGTK